LSLAEASLARDLRSALGADVVAAGVAAPYLEDATEARGLHGRADAVALPRDTEEVARVVEWCYERDVPVVPRGGGTGFAGGAVPLHGGVVVSLERLARVRSFEPLLWRMHVEAGATTAFVRRLARESGLLFPPDPGAAEQSQLGGNIATNAGGPHAFKYGVTGHWVTGLEVVVPPGRVLRFGGPLRKDVATYDLRGLIVGSEGTLGIVTAAWLRLVPAPETALPLAAFYADAETGCEAIERAVGAGTRAAALEYLDAGTLAAAAGSFPAAVPEGASFLVLADADGSCTEAEAVRSELVEALGEDALALHAPADARSIAGLWRWRDGVSIAVTAQLGGKVSEDIVVPLDRLGEAIAGTLEIGARHGLDALSWGHAGDGNLHSTFLVSRDDAAALQQAEAAVAELFDLALSLGGSISGEHGLG
jgi:FAD/FMN-containing dehydrogenase